jgi:hypothetical protein
MAILFDSVAPLVNIISFGSAPIKFATSLIQKLKIKTFKGHFNYKHNVLLKKTRKSNFFKIPCKFKLKNRLNALSAILVKTLILID